MMVQASNFDSSYFALIFTKYFFSSGKYLNLLLILLNIFKGAYSKGTNIIETNKLI